MSASSALGWLPGRLRRWLGRVGLGLLVGTLAGAAILALRGTYPVRVAENKTYDWRVRTFTDRTIADTSIMVVEIDDRSIGLLRDRYGRWPWPRDVHATLTEYAAYAGAKLVVFDVAFFEPDLERPAGDSVFADVIASTGKVILPVTFYRDDPTVAERLEQAMGRAELQEILRRFAVADTPPRSADLEFQRAEIPPALFSRAALTVGSISFSPDPEDAVSRRERLVYGYRGALYPSLAFAAARALAPQRFGGDISVNEDVLRTAQESVPLDRGRMLIRWRGPFRDVVEGRTTYRTLTAYELVHSYEQVLTGDQPEVSPEALKGKIVLIAPTAAGLLDLRANPFQGNEPGVFLHATILDNLLRGDYLRRAPGWANVGAVAAAALGAAAVVAAIPSATLASLAGLIVLLLSAALASGAFVLGFWLDLAPPIFAGALAFGGTMAMNYMTEGRDKRRVRDLFSRYVSPEYVRQLADDYQALKLGGERIPLTLLFSDIRGFTSISEKLPAEMVVQMLNEYLERMAEVVFRHGGTLDKFIGDAVMAFWGAPVRVPDHARRAAETALDMIEELEKLNQKWAAEGATARLNIGIGINTGEAVVGNIGSLSHKLDYTAIGDTVNLASRLEGLNKEYGTRIIVSETARAALGADYEVRPLDEVKVKGKEQAVKIYELLGRRSAAAPARAVALSLVAALLFASAGDLHGQAKARWTDMVYRPGSWRGAQVVPHPTSNDATDTLALVAQVETFSKPPRWRAEVRKIEDGKTLGQALVLIGDGKKIVVLTGLGSTPLGRHAAAKDPLVQAVAKRFDARGQPAQRGAARIVDRDAAGQVERVVLRRPAPRADFPDNLLSAGGAGRLGRSLLAVSMSEIGGKEREEVAATAGARGVARVRTVDGEITVMPDTAAVLLLEGMQVSVIDLDEFLRKARLGVYRAPVKKEEKP